LSTSHYLHVLQGPGADCVGKQGDAQPISRASSDLVLPPLLLRQDADALLLLLLLLLL
jgi:hypothetical protein